MSIFSSYKSEKTAFQQLPIGKQIIKLITVILLDSFLNHDGTKKAADRAKPWGDATPQLAITVVGVTNKGGMTHRLNGLGYMKYSQLTDAQIKTGKYSNHEGYACVTNKEGILTRIMDEAKTEQCKNILNELFYAVGLEEGSSIDDLVAAAAKGVEFTATVVKDEWGEKENYKLTKFRKATAYVETPALAKSDFEG